MRFVARTRSVLWISPLCQVGGRRRVGTRQGRRSGTTGWGAVESGFAADSRE